MSYELGIDLGTTYTAAAVCRSGDADVVTLGTNSAAVASVVYLGPDGTVLFGEAAERRAVTDPGRVVREFKRRIGDDTPLVIDGQAFPVHEIAARMIRWVADRVAEQEGGPARRIAVTHPASWGSHKKDLLNGALQAMGLRVKFLAEPQAAAVSYAAAERVDPGSVVAVYDLGGGTFDAALVRVTGNGAFELLGRPEGIERLGGVDFDEVVFRHVTEGLGDALEDLDPADPDVLTAVARLRRECVEAKEALSADTDVTIPVILPGVQTQARLTRAEFEAMIRPALERTVEALVRAVTSAGLNPDALNAVLLVGGSSRIPLVTRMVSAELNRPVAVDTDPRTAIALGAALVLSDRPRSAPARSHTIIAPGGMGLPTQVAASPGTTGFAPPRTMPPADSMNPPTRRGAPTGPMDPSTRRMPPAASGSMPRTGSSGHMPRADSGHIPRSSGSMPRAGSSGSMPRARHGAAAPRTSEWEPSRGWDPSQSRRRPAGGGERKSSGGLIAIGTTLLLVVIIGALWVWPGFAAGSGDTPPTQTTVPGLPGGGGGGGGGGGTDGGGNGGGGTGGGGNDDGGNGGGGNGTGGGGGGTGTTLPGGSGSTVTTDPGNTTSTSEPDETTSTSEPDETTTTPTTEPPVDGGGAGGGAGGETDDSLGGDPADGDADAGAGTDTDTGTAEPIGGESPTPQPAAGGPAAEAQQQQGPAGTSDLSWVSAESP